MTGPLSGVSVKDEGLIGSESEQTSAIFTVDSYANGVAFGKKEVAKGTELALEEPQLFVGPQIRSRYVLSRDTKPRELEGHLRKLQRKGELSESTIYFGVDSDPFMPFEGKFDASIKALEVFGEFAPGRLIVQTRSPLIVLSMPVLKSLGDRVIITIPVESHRQELVDKFSPGVPRLDDRYGASRALRGCGVKVCLQAAPLLPYGEWRKDAKEFAQILNENGDYITVKAIWDGTIRQERAVRLSSVGKRLTEAREFFYLRSDAAMPLLAELEAMCGDKLKIPPLPEAPKQMMLF